MIKLTQFCNFKRAPGKIDDFKNCSQALEDGDFLKTFEAHILLKNFFIKKREC